MLRSWRSLFSSIPGVRRSRSTRSSPRSLVFRNSGKCRALFLAVSTLTFSSRASNHSLPRPRAKHFPASSISSFAEEKLLKISGPNNGLVGAEPRTVRGDSGGDSGGYGFLPAAPPGTWTKPRRVVAKVEWHPGELYPRVGFIVTASRKCCRLLQQARDM